MAIELAALQAKLAELDFPWKAGVTSNSGDSLAKARSRTGYVPGPNDLSLEEARTVATRAASSMARASAVAGAPAAFDWRSKGGQNYVTPVTDQGGCGSCVAFGAVAAMESLVRITKGNANAAVDLSEAHLWFCWGPSHGAGACPDGGWWPDAAFDGMKEGVVDAACYPYTAANQACNPCADWKNRLTKITGWKKLTKQADMKAHLSTVGPVAACFTVYEDFYAHYAGGVYTYNAATAGKVVGGHCICIVGYDDAQGCWIAKNSWGSGWGESGYFRMSYGSCGLDAQMWAAEGIVGGGSGGSRMEIFARGSDKALWHMWQTAPSNGWSGWASLGGWVDSPVVARNGDGRLEVFVIGSDHALWHRWQTAPNNGWSGWASLGGWIDELTVGQNADGRLEVFARGADKALWHNWQAGTASGWSGWASLGGWVDAPAVARNADGRLEVFVIGSDHGLWHKWQTAPNSGWSGWASLGGWIDLLALSQNADGRLEVFARGSDQAVWHMWQTAPSSGWSGWASLGGWIDRLVVGQNAPVALSATASTDMAPPIMAEADDGAAITAPSMGAPESAGPSEQGGGDDAAMPIPTMPASETPASDEMPAPATPA